MRNLLLLGAAFGLTTAASAQVDSNVAQTDQTGVNSDAIITQSGTNNEARTVQNGAPGAFRNSATIEQTGQDHNAAGSEIFTIPEIRGFAASFDITGDQAPGIVQVGSGNVDKIDQDGVLNSAAVVSLGTDNAATVTQAGGFNLAGSIVNGADNVVTIDQSGSGNDLFGFNNAAVVGANGSGNDIAISQLDAKTSVAAVIVGGLTDTGADNTVDITQDGGSANLGVAFVVGGGNDIDMTQSGSLHDAEVSIESGDQAFLNNKVGVGQSGMGHEADVLILGDANTANVTQSGGWFSGGHDADVSITGSANTATISQSGGAILPF